MASKVAGSFLRMIGALERALISTGPWSLVFLTGVFFTFYAILSVLRPPQPVKGDEFCYLLMADTFAHGRLTNPVHPLHEFFQVFHVLMEPTYTAKFPIGLPVLFALGQVSFGMPILGAWLSVALGVTALYWALRPVLPVRWRLLAILFVGFNPLVVAWSQSYYGCGLNVLGGALVFGAVLRVALALTRSAKFAGRNDAAEPLRLGVLFGVGVSTLLMSRPFEGVGLTIACCLFWLLPLASARQAVRLLGKIGIGACLPLALTISFLLVYNRAVTGSALTLPYVAYTRQYDPVPLFIWESPRSFPVYSNPLMTSNYQKNMDTYLATQNGKWHIARWIFNQENFSRTLALILFHPYLKALWAVAILGIGMSWRLRWAKCLSFTLLSFLLVSHLTIYISSMTRYSSPGIVLMTYFLISGLRAFLIKGIQFSRLGGYRQSVYAGGFALFGVLTVVLPLKMSFREWARGYTTAENIIDRPKIEHNLLASGTKQLIIVEYTPSYIKNSYIDWVYNHADIDDAPVVWAHDLGKERNQALLRYFKHREVHRLIVSDSAKAPQLFDYYP